METDRQYNGQKKKGHKKKAMVSKHYKHKIKDWTRTPLTIGDEYRCSRPALT